MLPCRFIRATLPLGGYAIIVTVLVFREVVEEKKMIMLKYRQNKMQKGLSSKS